ncbi:MAG: hypothetical protein IJM19_07710, partial [Ruminococcus sp.]|nr:hypothetical protein [Ruminococcus sp.]
NSRTNPGDNYHTYYEQKTNCDWDKKNECLTPTKIDPANKTGACICDVITTVGDYDKKHGGFEEIFALVPKGEN